MIWHIPEQAVPGGLRPGDQLVDASHRRWTVLVVSPTASGRLIAWTRDWSAAFSAARSVDVERAEVTQGQNGNPSPVGGPWRPGSLRSSFPASATKPNRPKIGCRCIGF